MKWETQTELMGSLVSAYAWKILKAIRESVGESTTVTDSSFEPSN